MLWLRSCSSPPQPGTSRPHHAARTIAARSTAASEQPDAAYPSGRDTVSLLAYFLLLATSGLFVGALARLSLPGPDPMTLLQTIALGLAGNVIAGVVVWLAAAADRQSAHAAARRAWAAICWAIRRSITRCSHASNLTTEQFADIVRRSPDDAAVLEAVRAGWNEARVRRWSARFTSTYRAYIVLWDPRRRLRASDRAASRGARGVQAARGGGHGTGASRAPGALTLAERATTFA